MRVFSLVIVAIGIFAVCVFLFSLFISRGQYVYAVAMAALAVVLFFASQELYKYAVRLKKHEKENVPQDVDANSVCDPYPINTSPF